MVQTTPRSADEFTANGHDSDIGPGARRTPSPEAGRFGRARRGPRANQSPNRRLDGLIAVAVAILMAQGLGLPVSGGHLAVDMLLVCIGFRFARAVRNDADQKRRTRRFCFHQLGPILAPVVLYVGLVALYWSAGYWSAGYWSAGYWGEGSGLGVSQLVAVVGAATLTLNVLMIGSGADFVALNHLWVVAVIVQLGVLTPLLVLGGRRLLSAERRASALVALALVIIGGRLALLVTGNAAAPDLALATLSRMDGFLLGLAVGVAPLPALRRRLPIALAPVALAVLLLLFVAAPGTATTPWSTLGLLVPVAEILTALVVAWAATGGAAGAMDRTLDNQVAYWIGQRAISIYVWHQFFALVIVTDGSGPVALIDRVTQTGIGGSTGSLEQWPGAGVFATRLAFTLAAAAVSHRFLVMPAMSVAAGFLARTRSSPSSLQADPDTEPRWDPVSVPQDETAGEQTARSARHPTMSAGRPNIDTGSRAGHRFDAEPRLGSDAEAGIASVGPAASVPLALVPMTSESTSVPGNPDGLQRTTPLFTRNQADLTRRRSMTPTVDPDAPAKPVRRVPRPLIKSAPLVDHIRATVELPSAERPVRIQLRPQPTGARSPGREVDGPPPLLRT